MKEVQPIRDSEKITQIKNELKHQSYRDYFLFVMGINTGLRISDLLPLKVKDVRSKTHITIKEKKTDKNKRFLINGSLRSEIEEYTANLDDEAYLFANQRTKEPIQRVQAYKILNRVAGKVGLKEIGTHTLRKTFGYHYYKRTKDVAMLQEIFNHSSPSVTKRYIGITQEEIDQTLEDFSL
ncbi:site-specific integrase [Alkalibacillus haloalkaliphilus]|uniref:site-specific integrase n=1 Tax=Alkalibacillus haloalkaliphilus TaxID=94136 RepID=UPI0029362004|nr:site-specific integrase [Alkalibacillus haloalkaliphilus]MDV2583481.1 site-specific integrase [Alkalibacillus haloalkaliphilus]